MRKFCLHFASTVYITGISKRQAPAVQVSSNFDSVQFCYPFWNNFKCFLGHWKSLWALPNNNAYFNE